jgi:hypothetical protein
MPFSAEILDRLSCALGLCPEELTRPLSPVEDRAWCFYRRSARDRMAVWHKAQEAWTREGLSTAEAASIMGCSRQALSQALCRPTTRIFTFEAAQKLISAMGSGDEPEAWLPDADQRR